MKKVARTFIPLIMASFFIGLALHLAGAYSEVTAKEAQEGRTQGELVVNTLEDELNSDGDCSLREAIEATNTNSPVDACGAGDVLTDTITFSVAGIITVANELTIAPGGPLVIDGGGVITTSGGGSTPIWWVDTDGVLTLGHIAVVDGLETGLFNYHGLVTIQDSLFSHNTAVNYDSGGAIFNGGVMTIENSHFIRNQAETGGAIYNANTSTLTISNTTLSGNVATYSSGAIENDGVISINGSIFSSNEGHFTATLWNWGTASISDSIFNDNIGFTGGPIMNSGSMSIVNSTFSENAGLMGGSIGNRGDIGIKNSTFSRNIASTWGGAIYNAAGSMNLSNCTFSANYGSWGGAIYNEASLNIENSTFNANQAYEGGGINGSATITNTIIANSPMGGDCLGEIIDGGHNLDSDNTCNLDPDKGSLPNTNPNLEALQDNGGPTWTHALTAESPAIDAGDDNYCPITDQRGDPRPVDGDMDGEASCDMGAYEFQESLYLQPSSITKTGVPGENITYTLQLYNRTHLSDVYDLSIGAHSWETSLSAYQVGPLTPGGEATITMSVQIPSAADWYDFDTVMISSTSSISPTIYGDRGIYKTQAYAPAQIEVEPARLESRQEEGEVVTQSMVITNGNGVTLTFQTSQNLDQELMLHLDEPGGEDIFNDSSGNNRQAYCFSEHCPEAGVQGVRGTALDFDGMNDYLQLPPFELGGPLSISAWIHTRDGRPFQGNIIDLNLNYSYMNILLGAGEIDQGGKIIFYTSLADGNNQSISTDQQLPSGQWVHVVAVVDESGTGSIYWDGVLVKSGPLWTPPLFTRPNQYIGNGFWGYPFFEGMMDELTIYKRALSADEVMELYQNGVVRGGAPWLSVEPVTGTLASNTSMPVEISFDSTDMQAGEYTSTLYVISNDPFNSVVEIPITLSVFVNVAPELITISGPETGEIGMSQTFTAWVEPISTTLPITYTWQAEDQMPITYTGGLSDTISFLWDEIGTKVISVTARNIKGSASNTGWINIQDVPIAGLMADNDSPTTLGEATTLIATVLEGTNVSFSWDFGDGMNGEGAIITHSYGEGGIYTAMVTATNSTSVERETTEITIIETRHPIYLPLVIRNGIIASSQKLPSIGSGIVLLYISGLLVNGGRRERQSL